MKAIDLTGLRFERLVVRERCPENTKGGQARWTCLCDCGKTTIVGADSLRTGNTKSCGCFKLDQTRLSNTKHGQKSGYYRGNKPSPTYISWQAMKQRCLDPNAERYPNYGGAGVAVCDRWQGEQGFQNFLEDMGPRPVGTTLGRLGDVGNYEKSNCAWQNPAQQAANRRPDRKYRLKKQLEQIAA